MLQVFRDDSLPPDVLCLLVTDGDDTALIFNGPASDQNRPKTLVAMNALLAERDQSLPLAAAV